MARRYASLGRYVAVFAIGLSIPLLDISGPLLPQWNSLSPVTWVRGTLRDDLRELATNHQYRIQVLSTDPLMIYLDEFIHPREAKYLIELGYEQTCGAHLELNDQAKPSILMSAQDISPVIVC